MIRKLYILLISLLIIDNSILAMKNQEKDNKKRKLDEEVKDLSYSETKKLKTDTGSNNNEIVNNKTPIVNVLSKYISTINLLKIIIDYTKKWDLHKTLPINRDGMETYFSYSPNGKYLAFGGCYRIKIWETEEYNLLHQLEFEDRGTPRFAYDNKHLILPSHTYISEGRDEETGVEEGHNIECLQIFDSKSCKLLNDFHLKNQEEVVISLACSPNNRYLSLTDDRYLLPTSTPLLIIDLTNGNILHHLPYRALFLKYSPNGKYLVFEDAGLVNHKSKGIKVLDVSLSYKLVGNLYHNNSMESTFFEFSPDSKCLFTSKNNSIKLWDINSKTCIKTIIDDSISINFFCLSSSGNLIAVAFNDSNGNSNVKICDHNYKLLNIITISNKKNDISQIQFLPTDDKYLAISKEGYNFDGMILIYKYEGID